MVDLSKIKELCEKNGVTMKRAAFELGMTEQSLHKIIKANSTKIDTLLAITEYFHVEPTYFFVTENAVNDQDTIRINKQELEGLFQKVLAYSVNGFGLIKLEWDKKEKKFSTYFDRLKKQYELTEEDLSLVNKWVGGKMEFTDKTIPKDISKLLLTKDEFNFISAYYYTLQKMEVQEELQRLASFLNRHKILMSESIKEEQEQLLEQIRFYENKSIIGMNKK